MSDQNPTPGVDPSQPVGGDGVPAAPAAQPQESMWQQPAGEPAGAQQAGGQQQVAVAPQTSSNAIVALVLAITAWFVCPIIFAIVALVFANMGSKEIKASGGRVTGDGLVTGAKVVAWINIGLWAALLLIGIVVFAIIAIAGGMSEGMTGV
jgi:hypothetical protein